MKRSIFILLSFLFFFNVKAQDSKETIAVFPFTASTYSNWYSYRGYASGLSEIVVDALVNSNRFTVVDRTNFDDVLKEADLQKGEGFINGFVVEQGKKIGAKYIMTGTVINTSAKRVSTNLVKNPLKTYSGVSGYVGSVNYTLKIIDSETGEIIASETIKSVSTANLAVNTGEEAIANAVKNSDDKIRKFINKNFKIRAVVQKIRSEKKGVAKEIVIEGGSAMGFKSGQTFEIKEVAMVQLSNGKTVEQVETIGSVKITSVDNEYFSTCRVFKGGDAIKSKIDAGVKLYAMPETD